MCCKMPVVQDRKQATTNTERRCGNRPIKKTIFEKNVVSVFYIITW